LVSHPAKKEGIGLVEVLNRVTMQGFVRGDCSVVAATVQRDVDGIAKGSHQGRVAPTRQTGKVPLLGSLFRLQRFCLWLQNFKSAS
jgi:hypothetical protein